MNVNFKKKNHYIDYLIYKIFKTLLNIINFNLLLKTSRFNSEWRSRYYFLKIRF